MQGDGSPDMPVKSPAFDECIEMLRSPDSLTYDEGYHWLKGYLDDHIDELLVLMLGEADPGMRSRLVELAGESRNPKVIPFLQSELQSPYTEVRSFAYSSLLYFETPEAARIARRFSDENPDEDFL